jgi:FkbM family methyltransferase
VVTESLRRRLAARLPEPVYDFAVALRERLPGQAYPHQSWSQNGEDMILRSRLTGVGHYVDVGACHPRFGSNTFALYQRGWTGINIDARPGSMKAFRRQRSKDINLEVGIGAERGAQTFYEFDRQTVSTFDAERAEELARVHTLKRKVDVDVRPLSDILAEHRLPTFDLLSVDCEGYDLEVLRSNDWERFRPRFVIVESPSPEIQLDSQPIWHFMTGVGYRAFAATPLNLMFR